MTKKLLWTALLTLATTLAARLASQAAETGWRRATHEPPPKIPFWAKLMAKTPVGAIVKHNVPASRSGPS